MDYADKLKSVPELETKDIQCPNCKSKKYHIHGRIEKGKGKDPVQVYYYECDNFQCKKIFIKKD